MKITTGIDLVSVDRIKQTIEKNERFMARFFGVDEQLFFESKKNEQNRVESVAANFAAKEAFSKAIGTGIRNFELNEVQILRDELGAPYFALSGKAKSICDERGLQLSVSLSHTDQYATAVVIAYEII